MPPFQKGRDRGEGAQGYCEACERYMPDGPDVCLGMIPGVVAACCGHGGEREPYAILANREPERPRSGESWCEHPRVELHGDAATAFFALVRERVIR